MNNREGNRVVNSVHHREVKKKYRGVNIEHHRDGTDRIVNSLCPREVISRVVN